MDTLSHIKKGQRAEQDACDFLQRNGLTLVTRNYRCSLGEIDLVMYDGDELAFIEVRLRNHTTHTDAIDSVDHRKQQKLIKAANHFLSQQNLHDKVNCRFDIIGISYAQTKATFEWLQDAFSTKNL